MGRIIFGARPQRTNQVQHGFHSIGRLPSRSTLPMGGQFTRSIPAGFIWKGGRKSAKVEQKKKNAADGRVGQELPTKKKFEAYLPGRRMLLLGRRAIFGGGGHAARRRQLSFGHQKDGESEVFGRPDSSPNTGNLRAANRIRSEINWAGARGGLRSNSTSREKADFFEFRGADALIPRFTRPIADKNGEVWAGESHRRSYCRASNPGRTRYGRNMYFGTRPYGSDREFLDPNIQPTR